MNIFDWISEFFSEIHSKNLTLQFIVLIVIIVALPVIIFSSQQTQEVRQRAASCPTHYVECEMGNPTYCLTHGVPKGHLAAVTHNCNGTYSCKDLGPCPKPTPKPSPTGTPSPTNSTPPPSSSPPPPTDTPTPQPSSTPVPSTGITPTDTPTPQPSSTPVPSTGITPTDTPIPTTTSIPPTDTPIPTDTPTPTPSPTLGPPTGTIALHFDGIDNNNNPSPHHQQRKVTLSFYKLNNFTVPADFSLNILVSFVSNDPNGSFSNPSFDLSTIPSGAYFVLAKSPEGSLREILNNTQLINIQPGQTISFNGTNSTAPTNLRMGDLNNSNTIDMADYNILVDCYGAKLTTPTCTGHNASDSLKGAFADINDDGSVGGIDYNILIRNFQASGL